MSSTRPPAWRSPGARVSIDGADFGDDVETRPDGLFSHPRILLGYNNTKAERTVFVSAPGYFDRFAPRPRRSRPAATRTRTSAVARACCRRAASAGSRATSATPRLGRRFAGPGPRSDLRRSASRRARPRTRDGLYSLPSRPVSVLAVLVPAPGTTWEGLLLRRATARPTTRRRAPTARRRRDDRARFLLLLRRYARVTGVVTDRVTDEPIPDATRPRPGPLGPESRSTRTAAI